MQNMRIINRSIGFGQFGKDFRNITCTDEDPDEFVFNCMLFGDRYFYGINIWKDDNAPTSLF